MPPRFGINPVCSSHPVKLFSIIKYTFELF
uniref:Uncharacterized protein n=1 Tax=Anguilla anguilla TaxID=7936 RepID=A0A0E9QJK4_ANGAN